MASLTDLNSRLAKPYAESCVVEGNSNRAIHLGVLSKFPVRVTSHRERQLVGVDGEALRFFRDEPSAMAGTTAPLVFFRDVLQCEFDLDQGKTLAAFCVHLKSKTNPAWQMHAAETLRLAECVALADLIQHYRDTHPQNYVCVLGDCNDQYSSAALTPLRDLGLRDPLGDALKKAGRNPSTYWPKRRTRIDHILVDAELAKRVTPDSPMIHINQMARTASDHFPVSLGLDL